MKNRSGGRVEVGRGEAACPTPRAEAAGGRSHTRSLLGIDVLFVRPKRYDREIPIMPFSASLSLFLYDFHALAFNLYREIPNLGKDYRPEGENYQMVMTSENPHSGTRPPSRERLVERRCSRWDLAGEVYPRC